MQILDADHRRRATGCCRQQRLDGACEPCLVALTVAGRLVDVLDREETVKRADHVVIREIEAFDELRKLVSKLAFTVVLFDIGGRLDHLDDRRVRRGDARRPTSTLQPGDTRFAATTAGELGLVEQP